MRIEPFKLERYFAVHEFSAPHLLSCSDCEPLTLKELLGMADAESLSLWGNLRLAYTESQGHPLLREEITRLYHAVTPDDVLVLAPEEGIFIAMNVLLKAGDHLVTVFPCYQSLHEIARSLNANVSAWMPRDGNRFVTDDLVRLITPETRLLVLNFPHNPTGTMISRDELDRILELARKHDIRVFSDEMYRYLEYKDAHRLPSVADIYEKGISLSGMSKTFGLPGLRIGWLTTRDGAMMTALQAFKDYTTICSSGPSEILALIALKNKEKLIRRNLGIIMTNLKTLDSFFGKYPDRFVWQRPHAGPVAFPEVRTEGSIDDFCQDLLEQKGIMLVPSTLFGSQENRVRIGFGRRNIPEILEIWDDYLGRR
ncbi:aminotransferase class I/II-fold pyridoxal phosphate-dependent enzyme [bacterium]|nr:aminotransferase class I/II-fold pyridoxal phosphate-dependent enzyme [bacterium]